MHLLAQATSQPNQRSCCNHHRPTNNNSCSPVPTASTAFPACALLRCSSGCSLAAFRRQSIARLQPRTPPFTISTVFQSQVVEWIGTIRLRFLIFSFDLIDVYGKNAIATADALDDFVAYPRPRVSLTPDQDAGYSRILQCTVDQTRKPEIIRFLGFLPNGGIKVP